MSMDRPEVTIVIAVLNAAAGLEVTLRSIEQQDELSLDRVQVVVVDGGSTDGTLDVANGSSVSAVVVSEPDDGIYDAMNKGAALAAGHWLHFLNAGDSFSTPTALATALRGLTEARRTGRPWFVSGARYVGGALDGIRIRNVPHRWYRHALGLQPHCHQATWFHSEIFQALGGYRLDAGFVSDFDLVLRCGVIGRPGVDETVLIDYLEGGLSDLRAAEVPALIRSVRHERLQLDRIGQVSERVSIAVLRPLIKAGRARDRIRSVLRHREGA